MSESRAWPKGFGLWSWVFLLILGQSLSLSSHVQAQEFTPLKGFFSFTSEVQVLTEWRHHRVILINEAERQRLRSLREEGYICTAAPSSQYLCRQFFHIESLPQEAMNRLEQNLSELTVEFLPGSNYVELISEGEVYKELKVHNPVQLGSLVFASYQVMVLKDIVKVVIGGRDSEEYLSFVVESSNHLQLSYQLRQTHSAFSWSSFVTLVSFKAP